MKCGSNTRVESSASKGFPGDLNRARQGVASRSPGCLGPRSLAMEAIMTVIREVHRDEAALRKARMLIGGKWVESASGEELEVEDPAHRRPVAEVPRGGAEDVARAVNAAADAFPA